MRCQFFLFAVIQISGLMPGGFFAYAQNLEFDHLNSGHGLSESTILAMTQDPEGFMWFGTREGLNRYDARTFKVYRNDPGMAASLSDNFIYSLLSDRSGNLWIGTRNGLNLFDAKTERFRRFYSHQGNNLSLSDNTITCILEDRNGNKWIGTREGLNLMIGEDSISFLRFQHQTDNNNSLVNDDIHSMFEDSEGILWIGTSNGFSRLDYRDPENFSFRSFKLPGLKGKYEKNNSVNTFQEDAYGRLIVGTERNGLIFVDKSNYEFPDVCQNIKLESKAVRCILKDPSGNFWIGTIGGLFIANHNFTTIRNFRNIHDNAASLSDNSIRSIYYDRDGSFWIGTFHGGINVYSPLAKQFRHLQPRLDGQKISVKVASAMTSDAGGNFWIGTEGNGLFLLDDHSNILAHFKHEETNSNSVSHDNIKCLLLEAGKGIWIGTIKGLDFYDFRARKFTHFRNEPGNRTGLPDDVIYDLRKDGEGRLWVATYFGGLVRFNTEQRLVEAVFSHDPGNGRTLSSQTVTRVFLDSGNDLWVGTASGLNKQLPDGSFFRLLTDTQNDASPSGLYITSIFEDKHNQMWIGTRGAGLYLLARNGDRRRHFSETDGLPGNSVYAVQEDAQGFLWMSTENGLSRFDPETSHFKNYNGSDGLLCKEFNFNSSHRDDRGYFYFGGYNGVAWFHPDSTYENKTLPVIVFTAVRLFNRKITANDGHGVMRNRVNHESALYFQHNQNVFSIEFAVLNYINSPKNQFAYRLSGFEEEWNHVKEPVATYMNLAPGSYLLQVKGANNDGIWNETPKTISIHIFPPPWKTWWAYTGYCATFLLLLFGWARLNKKQMTLKHELELEHVEKVKQEEFHQAKLNFFTNIAHEIRTPVTLIASPIEHMLDSHSLDSKLKRELSLVKNNTDRLIRLLSQLLDFQKQETGNVSLEVRYANLVTFLGEIVDSFREYSGSRKVSLTFHTPAPDIYLWFDREELCKVFFNLLANALKFTPGGGEVSVSVSTESLDGISGAVRIIVQDNGLGIPSSQLEKIFHRFYQVENTGMQDTGFGIGLALSKGIIDLHHGTISVESREATSQESGSTKFTIDLKGGNAHFKCDEILLDADDCVNFTDEEHFSNIDTSQRKEDSEKHLILLVEDNVEIRRYMREMLSGLYNVLEGSNGSEGLAIAVERLPDLIVCDVMMPIMNGIELVSKLKGDPRTNHIPVIILTARGTVNHQVEGLERGADDYLTKPFHRNILLVKIKNALAIREKLKEKYSRIVSLQPRHQELENPNDQFLQRLMCILEENMDRSEFNVSRLVKEIGMSRPVLFRKTKMLTGLSVIDLLRNLRLKKAEMLLRQKKLSISEVAFTVGFNDPKNFSKAFRNQYGKSPSQYVDELG